jgi:RNA polymerase sigma-70 factor, ECF subfamily
LITLTLEQQCAEARSQTSAELWEAVFVRLTRQYGSTLERTCRGYERDQELRGELMQEIWLGLWRGLPRFQGKSSLRTWVYRVSHNLAVSHLARRSRLQEQPRLDIETLALRLGSAEHDLDRRRARRLLADLIQQLRPDDRQLILLYLEGLSYREISEITGLSTSNVTTRTARVRAALGRKADR